MFRLVVPFEVVDHLYYREIVAGHLIEDQGVAVFDDGEPLPVGMGIGGKIREKGVLRVIQKAKGSREDRLAVTLADALEHAIIPELRREEPGDRFRVSLVNAGKEEHFAAPAQLVKGLLTQLAGDQGGGRQLMGPLLLLDYFPTNLLIFHEGPFHGALFFIDRVSSAQNGLFMGGSFCPPSTLPIRKGHMDFR